MSKYSFGRTLTWPGLTCKGNYATFFRVVKDSHIENYNSLEIFPKLSFEHGKKIDQKKTGVTVLVYILQKAES